MEVLTFPGRGGSVGEESICFVEMRKETSIDLCWLCWFYKPFATDSTGML